MAAQGRGRAKRSGADRSLLAFFPAVTHKSQGHCMATTTWHLALQAGSVLAWKGQLASWGQGHVVMVLLVGSACVGSLCVLGAWSPQGDITPWASSPQGISLICKALSPHKDVTVWGIISAWRHHQSLGMLPCKMSSPYAASSLHGNVILWDIVSPWGRHPGRHHPMEHYHRKGHHHPMGTSPYWTSSPQKASSPHRALPPSGIVTLCAATSCSLPLSLLLAACLGTGFAF